MYSSRVLGFLLIYSIVYITKGNLEDGFADISMYQLLRLRTRFPVCRAQEVADDNLMAVLHRRLLLTMREDTSVNSFGVIGILGGGAAQANLAALAALRVGASRVNFFCSNPDQNNEKAFKTRNQHLNVYPIVSTDWGRMYAMIEVSDLIVIGPGFEEIQHHINVINELVPRLRNLNKPVIFQLTEYFITQQLLNSLIKYPAPGVVFIMNNNQFETLYPLIKTSDTNSDVISIDFEKYGANLLIYRKACSDVAVATTIDSSWSLSQPNSPRESPGENNFIAGASAMFWHRSLMSMDRNLLNTNGPMVFGSLGTYSAAALFRNNSRRTMDVRKRSGITSDMMNYITDYVYFS